jgi:hypothetical protein
LLHGGYMLSTDQVEDVVTAVVTALGSAALTSAGLSTAQTQLLVLEVDRVLRGRLALLTAVRIEADTAEIIDTRPDAA